MRIALIQDLRIGDVLDANVLFAVPTNSLSYLYVLPNLIKRQKRSEGGAVVAA